MTASDRAAVNAANAQLSTGPKTPEGKIRSSRNAVKHGLTSKQLVIAPGEEQEFAEFHDSLFDQLAPVGALEMGLFNMIVHAAWNLERFRTLEAQLMAGGVDSLLDEKTAKALDRLQRYASANQRSYFQALRELRTVQSNRTFDEWLEGKADPLPELVSLGGLLKRSRQHYDEDDMAEWRIRKESLDANRLTKLQNKPIAPASARRQEVA
jgi:hypothetical protein